MHLRDEELSAPVEIHLLTHAENPKSGTAQGWQFFQRHYFPGGIQCSCFYTVTTPWRLKSRGGREKGRSDETGIPALRAPQTLGKGDAPPDKVPQILSSNANHFRHILALDFCPDRGTFLATTTRSGRAVGWSCQLSTLQSRTSGNLVHPTAQTQTACIVGTCVRCTNS